jgi:hypothetical protein
MRKKTLILLAIVCVIIIIVSAVYINAELTPKPMAGPSEPSLAVKDFMVYKQNYGWWGPDGKRLTETRYVFWNVTAIEGKVADVQVHYYTVEMPANNLTFTETLTNIKVNMTTREIINTNNPSKEFQVGSIFSYWISPSMKFGDPLKISLGQKVSSTKLSNPAQTLQVLNNKHECWLISYLFDESEDQLGTYGRYYDVNSGFCLKNEISLILKDTKVDINETAVTTNIESVLYPPTVSK